MAEGILRDRIEKEGVEGIRVASAGTWGLEGEPAAKHAVKVCSDRGIDISGHVARRLTGDMIEESDLVLTMEMDHLQGVLDLVADGLLTPAMVHFGNAPIVLARRQTVLDAAYAAHPERFVRHAPVPLSLPAAVWINKPRTAEASSDTSYTKFSPEVSHSC